MRHLIGSLVLLPLVGVLSLVAVAPAGAQDPPTVTVTPTSDPEDGDIVTVTGEGFAPTSAVFILLCATDTTLGGATERCSLIGEGTAGYLTDAEGRFTATDIAVAVGQVGSNPASTCPPSSERRAAGAGCSIAVAADDLVPTAEAPVSVVGDDGTADRLPSTGRTSIELTTVAISLVLAGVIVIGMARTIQPVEVRRRRDSR